MSSPPPNEPYPGSPPSPPPPSSPSPPPSYTTLYRMPQTTIFDQVFETSIPASIANKSQNGTLHIDVDIELFRQGSYVGDNGAFAKLLKSFFDVSGNSHDEKTLKTFAIYIKDCSSAETLFYLDHNSNVQPVIQRRAQGYTEKQSVSFMMPQKFMGKKLLICFIVETEMDRKERQWMVPIQWPTGFETNSFTRIYVDIYSSQ